MKPPIHVPIFRHAFTLIELMIVVAIIAILAAIAVPNFLEAQTRSKVSREKSDMRSLATALETYRVDNNRYPTAYLYTGLSERMRPLTTPISYISSQPKDPFFRQTNSGIEGFESNYVYCSGNIYFGPSTTYEQPEYFGSIYSISGRGPDGDIFFGGYCMAHPVSIQGKAYIRGSYDPTNGTISSGDVIRLSSGTLGGNP